MGENFVSKIWEILPATILGGGVMIGVAGFVASRFIDTSIKRHVDRALEDYKFQLKSKEQAAMIAEYTSLAQSLRDTDDDNTYRRANQLAWQLLLWLPEETYRKLGRGLVNKEDKRELVEALIDVRTLLLKDKAGNLNAGDIIIHAPGVGKVSKEQAAQAK